MAMTYAELESITRKMLEGRGVTHFEQRVDAMNAVVVISAIVNGKPRQAVINEREMMAECHSKEAMLNFLQATMDHLAPPPKPTPPGLGWMTAGTSFMMPMPSPYEPPAKLCPFCGRQRRQTPCEGCGSNYVA